MIGTILQKRGDVNVCLECNPNTFKNKTARSPCDDPGWRKFTCAFAENFKWLDSEELLSTSHAAASTTIFNVEARTSYFFWRKPKTRIGKARCRRAKDFPLQAKGSDRSGGAFWAVS